MPRKNTRPASLAELKRLREELQSEVYVVKLTATGAIGESPCSVKLLCTAPREDSLPPEEEKWVLSEAKQLWELGCSPASILGSAIEAELRIRQRLPVRDNEWHVDYAALAEMLREPLLCNSVDVLYSPSLLDHLCACRHLRSVVGIAAERQAFSGPLLDSLTDAIAMKPKGGRPPKPLRDQDQDACYYWVYLRIQIAMASSLGKKPPKAEKLARILSTGPAWTRKEFEPYISRQLAAYRADKGRGRMSLSDRAALVLLGIQRAERQEKGAVSDDDLDRARREVTRLEHSLHRNEWHLSLHRRIRPKKVG